MNTEPFETGDSVHHGPSGENWLVAYCRNGDLCPCGWPETIARASDCTLIEKGMPEERDDLLRRMAAMRLDPPSYYDSRQSYAAHRLAEEAKGAAK